MTQEFVCESCVRGHHIYKDIWVPGNDADPYSVAIINSSMRMTVVGHESMAEEGTLEDSALCGLEHGTRLSNETMTP